MYKNKPLPDKNIRKEKKFLKKIVMLLMYDVGYLLNRQDFIDYLDSWAGPNTDLLKKSILNQATTLKELESLRKKSNDPQRLEEFKALLSLVLVESFNFYHTLFDVIHERIVHFFQEQEFQQWQEDNDKDDDEPSINLNHYH